MKKFLTILSLIPSLLWAFPVYTNRLDFDPRQSTGAFDDFLWRWSGYDDQSVELIFRNITAPSNVGFRLAYPQRGKTFLDVLNITTPSNVNTEVITPWNITYNYNPLYPTITTPAVSNVVITNFTLYTIDGVLSLSNRVVNTSIPTNVVNVFDSISITGRPSITLSNLYLAATSIVSIISNSVVTAPSVRIHTNYVLGVTGTTTTVDSKEYYPVQNGNTNFYSIGASAVQNGGFDTTLSGWSALATNGSASTNVYWSAGAANMRIDTILQQTISGLEIGQRYFLAASFAGIAGSVTVKYEGRVGSSTNASAIQSSVISVPGNLVTNFWASGSGFSLDIRPSGITSSQVVVVDNVFIRPVITNKYVNTSVIVTNINTEGSFSTNFQSAISATTNKIYSVTTNNYYQTSFSIGRTNIPPDGPYFAEVLTYSGATPTNATQTRTLAKGQITIENSIWGVTNYAGYTNYAGPWDYILRNGSRDMQGNLNMGGYSVTNTSSILFTNGSSVTPADVATWNSFISSTSSLNAGTVFGGQVTGTYNNLTLKKDVLDNMQFVDWSLTPTGSVSQGRVQWDSARDTLKLGLNANVNLDLGQQLMLYARNVDTNTIAKGEVVYVSGASGDNPAIKRASNASEATSARTIGIAAESISVNGFGMVVTRGTIYGLNTTNFVEGANLYLGANGTLQTNIPIAPTHGVFIGTVERSHQNVGQIYIAVQNYQEIEELSDVNVRSVITNDLLIYNGTVWTNYARTNLALQSSLSGYLPLAGGTMSGNINFYDTSLIDPLNVYYNGELILDFSVKEFYGQWTIPGYLTTTGSVNAANLTNLSAIAGSGLSVSNNQLIATGGSITNYLSLSGGTMNGQVDMNGNIISGLQQIIGENGTIPGYIDFSSVDYSSLDGAWRFFSVPEIPGYITTNGNARNLTNFPSSLLTISAAQSNYWQITTAPVSNNSFGQRGHLAVSGTNMFIYSPDALGSGTGRWGRVGLNIAW